MGDGGGAPAALPGGRWLLLWVVLLLARAPVALPQGGRQEGEELPVVTRVLVEGNRRYSDEELLRALGQEVGEPFDDAAVNRGIQRLWDLYRVRATTSFRPVPGGLELRLQVVEIPVDLEPRFIGNDEVGVDELLEWAGLEEGQELYFNEAQRVARRIEDGYLREGFYFVEVNVVTREPAEGEGVAPDIIFEIREGPHVTVRDVVIDGNRAMPERGFLFWKSGLRHFADIELRGPILGIFKKGFVEETLEADLQAMREVYRRRGYLDAVVQLDRLEFSDDRSKVTVHIQVDEGPLYHVASLRIEGVDLVRETPGAASARIEPAELLFPEEELLAQCDLGAGEPFDRAVVAADRAALRRYYGERGYIDHPSIPFGERFQFLEPELLFDVGTAEVHVVYRLVQGERQFIREVLFAGGLHTRDRVMRRLVTISPGDQADLAEITRSLNRIRATGYFQDPINPGAVPEPTFRFLETDDPSWKDLLFEVTEGSPLTFTFGGGVSTNTGVFGQIQLRIRNFDISSWPDSPWSLFSEIGRKEAFHGAGQELFIFAQPGTEDARFRISFTDPDIFRRHFDRIGLTLEAAKRFRRYRTHDEERDEYLLRFSRQVTPDSSVWLGYRVADVQVDDLALGGEPVLTNPLAVPSLLKDQEGDSNLSYFDLGWRWNTFDHPFNPRSGKDLALAARVYEEGLGSDFSFVRAEVSGDFLQPLGDPEKDVRPSFRYRFSLGSSFAYGSTDAVPYTERFFLGGTRLRGFELRGVGPNENGFPVGGETYAYGSVECRCPIYSFVAPGNFREQEALRGFLFVDSGVLGPDSGDLDLDEVRLSAGFGFGVSLGPLPLVLTFGFPVVEGAQDREQRFSFNLGF